MRSWAKRWAVLAGGMLGLGELANPAAAQVVPPAPNGNVFCADPQPGPGPDFPNAAPPPPTGEVATPFSFQDERAFNAFCDGPNPPRAISDLAFSFEGLAGFTKQQRLNLPLATTTASPNTTNSVGAIGSSTTTILAGNDDLDRRLLAGARFGAVMTPTNFMPMECSFFYIDQIGNDLDRAANAAGSGLLARPVFATQPIATGLKVAGQSTALHLSQPVGETVFLSSFPDLATGKINIRDQSRLYGFDYDFVFFRSADDNAWGNKWCNCDFFGGFRYIDLSESINITNTTTPLNSSFAVAFDGTNFGPGNTTFVNDQFRTHNRFRGGELGGRLNFVSGPWFATMTGRVGVGSIQQIADIGGTSTLQTTAGGITTVPGGLLAVASNSGSFSREQLGVVPQGALNFGVDVSSCIRLQVGYSFLYMNNVVRPGDLISRQVDTRQVPTDLTFNSAVHPSTPAFEFKTTDFWLQSLNIGITLQF